MSKAIVVANTSPVIFLQKIGQLDLLSLLYSRIHIPEAVYKEVIVYGTEENRSNNLISAHSWIDVIKIKNTYDKKLFTTNLHDGEIETIMLAMEMSADLCIIDDLLARKYAKNVGLNITGTLGILLLAKEKEYLKSIKPLLEELTNHGMYIGKELFSAILTIAKES